MKKTILLILSLSLFACAGQTPLQHLSSRLDVLDNNLLSDMTMKDAQATLQDVEKWKPQLSESDYLQAKSCAEYVIVAHDEKAAMVAAMQQLLLNADSAIVGLQTDGPMLIRRLTAAKYAPQGEPGANVEAQVKELEARAIKLVSGLRHACGNLIDDQMLIRLGVKAMGM